MKKSIACSAPYGGGGLGRHFSFIVEEARQAGTLDAYYSSFVEPGDRHGHAIQIKHKQWLNYTPLRYSPGWLNHLENDWFDRAVARHLAAVDEFEGFGGQALHSFKAAQTLGCTVLSLQAANSHVANVWQKHQQAIQRYPFEQSWLNKVQCKKTIQEYAMADVIYVASDYTYQTFLSRGFSPQKLKKLRMFDIPARFTPAHQRTDDGIFRIVYIGSLTVMKGVPILIDAFSKLETPNAELILIGGWATRGMRRYIQSALAKDSRIRLAPGDPLPHLQRADVLVHPTFEDGFAYAPMEALACNVPVIVTEDTGMKEHIKEGVNGYIVPTGDMESILERLIHLQRSPLLRGVR